MNTKWQHEWTSGNKEISQFGYEIRRQGGQFSLFRPRDGNLEWAGLFQAMVDAKDAAEQLTLNELRAELHTGQVDHVVVEGRGGIWDCTVAQTLAAGHTPETVPRVFEISDTIPPEGPVVCVPIELVRNDVRIFRPYVLVGWAEAKAHEGAFPAVVLTFEEAEVARVPDITDTPIARATARSLQDSIMKIGRLKTKATGFKRSAGDLAKQVRDHLRGLN
jgi:hypothetical protein